MKSISRLLMVGGLASLGCLSAYATERVYSPFADVDYPTQVYWGDTHLHTSNSADALMSQATLGPEQAYRFARGEEVISSSGIKARLIRPLDFLVISDHANLMGVFDQLVKGNPVFMKVPELRELRDEIKKSIEGGVAADESWVSIFDRLGTGSDGSGGSLADSLTNSGIRRSIWDSYIETADRYNDPGRFTALIGYEWTPTQDGNKLHRVLIYRGDSSAAGQFKPFSSYDSPNPQDLWKFMQAL